MKAFCSSTQGTSPGDHERRNVPAATTSAPQPSPGRWVPTAALWRGCPTAAAPRPGSPAATTLAASPGGSGSPPAHGDGGETPRFHPNQPRLPAELRHLPLLQLRRVSFQAQLCPEHVSSLQWKPGLITGGDPRLRPAPTHPAESRTRCKFFFH